MSGEDRWKCAPETRASTSTWTLLPRGGVLAGTITDELGEPYPGVRVDALALRYQQGRRQPFPVGVATTNDFLGSSGCADLEPGSYYVSASLTETWRTEKGEVYGYALTYFPGGPMERAGARDA